MADASPSNSSHHTRPSHNNENACPHPPAVTLITAHQCLIPLLYHTVPQTPHGQYITPNSPHNAQHHSEHPSVHQSIPYTLHNPSSYYPSPTSFVPGYSPASHIQPFNNTSTYTPYTHPGYFPSTLDTPTSYQFSAPHDDNRRRL